MPFEGFYNSLYESEMDNALEQRAESMAEHEYVGFEASEIQEILFRHADFGKAMNEIAAKYVDAFSDYLDVEYGVNLDLKFKAMESPKEYNFTTDRLFADITFQQARELCKATTYDAIKKVSKREFTSRSGFISFYSSDIATWGHRREWDHNQLWCVLMAVVEQDQDWRWSVFYAMQESVSTIMENNIDWEKVEYDLMCLIEDLLDDGRKYPVGVTDPAAYVAKFVAANNYMGGE